MHADMQQVIYCEGSQRLLCMAGACEARIEVAPAQSEDDTPAFFQEYRTVRVAAKLRRSTFSGKTTRKNTPMRY
jgi:hypothetical protein